MIFVEFSVEKDVRRSQSCYSATLVFTTPPSDPSTTRPGWWPITSTPQNYWCGRTPTIPSRIPLALRHNNEEDDVNSEQKIHPDEGLLSELSKIAVADDNNSAATKSVSEYISLLQRRQQQQQQQRTAAV